MLADKRRYRERERERERGEREESVYSRVTPCTLD